MKTEITEKQFEALKSLLEYVHADELDNYMFCGPEKRKNHIYNAIKILMPLVFDREAAHIAADIILAADLPINPGNVENVTVDNVRVEQVRRESI